jgi:hypothetical protein
MYWGIRTWMSAKAVLSSGSAECLDARRHSRVHRLCLGNLVGGGHAEFGEANLVEGVLHPQAAADAGRPFIAKCRYMSVFGADLVERKHTQTDQQKNDDGKARDKLRHHSHVLKKRHNNFLVCCD